MAPEIMTSRPEGRNPYTWASDVYAYGVVLFEIFAGELPYQNKSFLHPGMVIYMVGSGKMKPDLARLNPKDEEEPKPTYPGAKMTPEEIRKLLELCIEYDPNVRPSFIDSRTETRFEIILRKKKYYSFENFDLDILISAPIRVQFCLFLAKLKKI